MMIEDCSVIKDLVVETSGLTRFHTEVVVVISYVMSLFFFVELNIISHNMNQI